MSNINFDYKGWEMESFVRLYNRWKDIENGVREQTEPETEYNDYLKRRLDEMSLFEFFEELENIDWGDYLVRELEEAELDEEPPY